MTSRIYISTDIEGYGHYEDTVDIEAENNEEAIAFAENWCATRGLKKGSWWLQQIG